jgi:hypothetical protein
MKPSPFHALPVRRSFLILFCLLTVSTGLFANDGFIVSEKLLQTFKNTFPDADQVRWQESPDKYSVDFRQNGVLTKIDYDRDGNFVSSLRYYTEKNLPINILCRLQKKYSDKKVFGVTEVTTDSMVEYFIKLEDQNNWLTIRSDAEGNMQPFEKYKKAS